MRARNILQNLLILSLATIIIIGLLEISLRLYHIHAYRTPFSGTFAGATRSDELLGWVPMPFYSHSGMSVDNAGVPYAVDFTTYQDGFREWPQRCAKGWNVLFIGDSYTKAREVSNNKTYYSVAKAHFPMNVFAFGGGGYGSQQEHMILDRYLDEIEPDIIVWQFTPNDFFDNNYSLDSKSGGVARGRRPYLIDQDVEYRIPLPPINRVLFEVAEVTSLRLLYMINGRIARLLRSGQGPLYGEVVDGLHHDDFAQSYETTLEIMRMVVERADNAKILSFSVIDRPDLFYDAYQEIMKTAGVEVITDVPQALNAASARGIEIKAADGGHWNETGHEIAGVAVAHGLAAIAGTDRLPSACPPGVAGDEPALVDGDRGRDPIGATR